jgi:hypothetical protein
MATRLLKEAGLAPVSHRSSMEPREWPLPSIRSVKPSAGYEHPASPAAIQRLLRDLGEEPLYGLRSIELVRRPKAPASHMLFGRLLLPGRILVYEVPNPPWTVRASLAATRSCTADRRGRQSRRTARR